ncbi:MAG: alpha/beta fold hydrolase [Holophagales bacterium]|nr:alpha/beta fold hydrolase [Holophagales bacterium]MBK9967478.1 alpha/beta fold hydrolase [Holophagales bacterium]
MVFDSACIPSSHIHFEVHGEGVPLFLGFPLMASQGEIFGEEGAAVLRGYLDRLTDRYRVLVADYPSIGRSGSIPTAELTADRVSTDLLRVADAAGFDRFAFWGFSWGGAAGLQLASRTDRLTALVCGGWPPLGGPYAEILRASREAAADPPASATVVLREPAQYAQWVTFYESVLNWPEAEAVARIACPRMAYAGSEGDPTAGHEVPISIASTIRDRRGELEAMGWRVTEIPGRDHSVCLDPATVVPLVRDFLDAVS